jgi:hypothetical protein
MRQHKNSCESLSLAKESISSYPYITSYTLLAELADRAYLEDWDTEEAVKYGSILNNLELDPEKNIFYAFSTPERVPECIASLSRNNKKWYIIIGRSDSEVVNNYAEFILKHDFIIGIASQNRNLHQGPTF